ncbi:acyl-CoA dehydrogenase family protein [Pseudomonas vancouverensis]|uniref:Pimeloyl-CoA dehydrogenase small subunit n=1 Tax=Pseudomonas vancouverensis TaxID=95300 RepID=A0A1H2NGY3_PSEVA|nr:acyl-CoA dehydrogenase [Pseudomonas vancouverensis]KAB0489394.1 pimeloyl-CoA dehydrogenase small subunit [Pseudomonas vancouverensis]TDB60908.1 pimeloyl-CoA dehydrogenase small subunit [Pseudomonas vancouverensis]SDV04739.1 Acyl-CoA dehydrogenase [Pseudomonas vancouverensis]
MDFKLTEEQLMLQDTAARLVRDVYGFEHREQYRQSRNGFSNAFMQQLGDLGLCAVPFAETYGGYGGSGVDNMLIMTELGRGLCLEPYLHSVIFAGGLIDQLGSAAQKDTLLPQIASAGLQVAVALEEPQSHYQLHDVQTRAEAVNGGWTLNGRKSVIIGGHSAGLILVSARTSHEARDEQGISLFLIDPQDKGVTRRAFATMDGRMACELYLDDVFVKSSAVLGDLGQALSALRYQQGRCIAAQCAEAVGSMEAACALTLDYLKTRQQFGQPIGKFQALQHRMVDMRIELDQATSMTLLAACVADQEDSDERSRVLAAAKFIVSRASRFVADQGIQLHGGIGLTWEYMLSHHAKHLLMVARQFGDDDHHLQAYAKLMQVA